MSSDRIRNSAFFSYLSRRSKKVVEVMLQLELIIAAWMRLY